MTLIHTGESKDALESMKNYERKSDVFRFMIKNMRKLIPVQMTIYLSMKQENCIT